MNSPTIAAVVPSLKPQAGPGSEAANAGNSSFADVLAGQAPAAEGSQAGGRADSTASTPSERAGQDGMQSAEAKPRLPRSADNPDEEADAANEALSALPQIALEIALHARGQAVRGDAPPHDAAATAEAARTGAARAALSGDTEALPAALRGEAAAAQKAGELAFDAADAAAGTAPAAGASTVSAANRSTAADSAVLRRQAAARSSAEASGAASGATPNAMAAAPSRNGADLALGADRSALLPGDAERGARPAPAAEPSQPSLAGAGAAPGMNPFALPGSPASTAAPAIATPLHHADWNADFGRQVLTLARDAHSGTHTAELRLDPPELGPLRITLSLNDGLASAVFVSAHASVRQAVESALPQLSQQLAQAGISLGQTHVGDQGQPGFAFDQGSGQASGQASGPGRAERGGIAAAEPAPPRASGIVSNALVDTFA